MRRGQWAGEQAALPGCDQDWSLRPCVIEHRQDVVDQCLDRGRVAGREALRTTEPTTIGHDEPTDASKLAEEAGEHRVLPVHLHVRDAALHVEQIDRALPDDLVCERHLVVPCVPDVRSTHRRNHHYSDRLTRRSSSRGDGLDGVK
jgi:hypothetical protein